MIKVIKVTHYEITDVKCNSDYGSIDLLVEKDGEVIFKKTYGDSYHDKGDYKVEGILDFIKAVFGEYELDSINIADEEW